ncbi:MAG: zf-HC2 domain-containing protein [Blastocatellia bacterium]
MSELLPFDCRAAAERLPAYAGAECGDTENRMIHAHLEHCGQCLAALGQIRHARALAASQRTESPEQDRYPEFLRRLAARRPQALQSRPLDDAAVSAVAAEQYGLAVAAPLWGNRLLARYGPGRGLDVRLVSRSGGELFHLSARSMARVVAVTTGAAVCAAAMGAFVFMLLFTRGGQTPPPRIPVEETGAAIEPGAPRQAEISLQAVSAGDWTLALWQGAGTTRAALYARNAESAPTPLELPRAPGEQEKHAGNAPADLCTSALASDGAAFLMLRQSGQALWSTRIDPAQARVEALAPTGFQGTQPALAWMGNRYMAVWTETADPGAPRIRMGELDREGRPVAGAPTTVVAETWRGAKPGMPAVAVADDQALLVWHRQGSGLRGRLYEARQERLTGELTISAPLLRPVARPFVTAVETGWMLAQADTDGARSRIQLMSMGARGETIVTRTLIERAGVIRHADYGWRAGSLAVLWIEAAGGDTMVYTQRFLLDGSAQGPPRRLFSGLDAPPVLAGFADVAGANVFWLAPRDVDSPLRREAVGGTSER